ncbi:DUF6170 family protein [Bowmanella yangjiangensis]|uniref:Uncharacterized protein n=1 Tax=Bowmanella yangjiangensis TaxID=2811230 RepID=A0ABS3CTH1_9ALTE|nr:DUF6170 family protein [Bowmanella yangjiangensis]MBN7820418.1 hypothetical protein [Bowmanella yangjiangensis]
MKLYLSSRNIPALSHLPLNQRLARLNQAARKLSLPEKMLLNILKLLILLPLFVFIMRASDNWWALFWAALVIMAYPLVLKPVQYALCEKYLSDNQ